MYRSNYALIGLSLVELICGEGGLAEAALLSVVSVSLFNAFAVISLSVFKEENKKIDFKGIIIDIIRNPAIPKAVTRYCVILFDLISIKMLMAAVRTPIPNHRWDIISV